MSPFSTFQVSFAYKTMHVSPRSLGRSGALCHDLEFIRQVDRQMHRSDPPNHLSGPQISQKRKYL